MYPIQSVLYNTFIYYINNKHNSIQLILEKIKRNSIKILFLKQRQYSPLNML